MKTLAIKIHPNYFAWAIDKNNWGTIELVNDPIENMNRVQDLFFELSEMKIKAVLIEKPFLKLYGENKKALAKSIIHIQRLFGAVLFMIEKMFEVAPLHINSQEVRQKLYGDTRVSKDRMLSEVNHWSEVKDKVVTVLEEFCIFDCMTMLKVGDNK